MIGAQGHIDAGVATVPFLGRDYSEVAESLRLKMEFALDVRGDLADLSSLPLRKDGDFRIGNSALDPRLDDDAADFRAPRIILSSEERGEQSKEQNPHVASICRFYRGKGSNARAFRPALQ